VYARVSTFQGDPASVDDAINMVRARSNPEREVVGFEVILTTMAQD
jgi:hypothetical protein